MTDLIQTNVAFGGLEFTLTETISTGDILARERSGFLPSGYVSYLATHSLTRGLLPEELLATLWLSALLTSMRVPHWGMLQRPASATFINPCMGELVKCWQNSKIHEGQFEFPVYVVAANSWQDSALKDCLQLGNSAPPGPNNVLPQVVNHAACLYTDTSSRHLVVIRDAQTIDANVLVSDFASFAPNNIVVFHSQVETGSPEADRQFPDLEIASYFHNGQVLYQGKLEGPYQTQFAAAVKT